MCMKHYKRTIYCYSYEKNFSKIFMRAPRFFIAFLRFLKLCKPAKSSSFLNQGGSEM